MKPETKPETTVTYVLLISGPKRVRITDGKLFVNDSEYEPPITTGAEGTAPKKFDPETEGWKMVRAFYNSVISKPYENVVVLTGAGTSKPSGGKTMNEFWQEHFPEEEKAKNDAFFDLISFPIPENDKDKNIEELLSQARNATRVLKARADEVIAKVDNIQKSVVAACTISLSGASSHLKFLNKITSKKLKHSRVKVFTLNYDTLFEQAAAEGNFIVINGFSFTSPSHFNGVYFDYDIVVRDDARVNPIENFVKKVFHLYKPHGSINWIKDGTRILAEDIKMASADPVMIYPNSSKYESGYDQPFFEMMSRFQAALRQRNSLLICIGFSFGDKHFRSVITEAIKTNPGLFLIIVAPNFASKAEFTDLQSLAQQQNNIMLVSETFDTFTDHYPFAEAYSHDDNE